MKTIYKGSGATVTLYWKIMRGENKVTEDLSDLKRRVFLIGSCNTYSVTPEVVTDEELGNKVLKVEVKASMLDTGVYDVKAMWEKNDGRNIMKSARTGVFAITDNSEEVDEIKGEEVIRIASYVESIGRDGLSAYEIAVIRGLNNGLSENDWVGNEAERIKAERERESAETTRKENETARVNAEGDRQSEFNTFMTVSTTAFSNAQMNRETAFTQAQEDREAAFTDRIADFEARFNAAEDNRNDGEAARNANYEAAEKERDSDYATAEANRNKKYNQAEEERDSTIQGKLDEIEGRFTTAENARKSLFNENERTRQQNEELRINAEGSRQKEFEDNEQRREKTFQDNEQRREKTFQDNEAERGRNEQTRDDNERIREQSEQARIDTFDENERGRIATFNANEAARIAAENERKQKEAEREINEAIRQESYKDKLPVSAVVQETGGGENVVMSQKSTTKRIYDIKTDVSRLEWVELSANANYMYDGSNIIESQSAFRSIIIPVNGEVLRTKGHWYTIVFLEEYPTVGAAILSVKYWDSYYADPRSISVPTLSKYAMLTVADSASTISINASKKTVNESLSELLNERILLFSSLGEEYVDKYGYGIKDINVVSNGGYDVIKLSALYKTADKFLCQFTDNAGTVLCQKYIQSASLLPTGLNRIMCTEFENSGVNIEILVDVDNISTVQALLSVQPTISQKNTYPAAIKTNKQVKYVEKDASSDASSRIQELIKAEGRFVDVKICRTSGLACLWRLYVCTDEFYSNLTLIKDNLISDIDYSIDLGGDFPYIYIWSFPNDQGFKGRIEWDFAESLAEKEDFLTNVVLSSNSRIVPVNIDAEAADTRVMALADNVGKVVKCNFVKEIGDASVYSVFMSQTSDLRNIELVAENLEFNKDYILELRELWRYLYIFTPSYNPNSFRGDFIYSLYGESMSDKIKKLEDRDNIGYKPFSKKTIVCFGDSVTEFGNYPAGIASRTGATVYNVGFGGCHLAKRRDTSSASGDAYDKLSMYNLARFIVSRDFTELDAAVQYIKNNEGDDNTSNAEKLKSIDFNNVDILTIFYGTNDYTQGGKELGEVDSEDISTIRGAINYIIKTIQTAYPHINIVFITPTHRLVGTDNSDSDKVEITGLTLSGIAECIVDQANINHVPAINMYKESGFNAYNHKYYFADGVHPNQKGYDHIADRLSAYLYSLYNYGM